MVKLILPIIFILLLLIFWGKIKHYLKTKLGLNLNYILIAVITGLLIFILLLLYY